MGKKPPCDQHLLLIAPAQLHDDIVQIAHLDLHHQIVVLQHLERLARERDKAIVLSLHDPNLALRFATHAVVVRGDASVRAGAIDAVIDAAELSTAYGHPVIAIGTGARRVFVPE